MCGKGNLGNLIWFPVFKEWHLKFVKKMITGGASVAQWLRVSKKW